MSICRRYVSIDEACKERETYTEEENRKLRAAKIMIQYLKYRCYYPTSVMNYTGAFQRTGPFPTRAYRHLEIMANRIRREKHQANTPPIPLQEWPVLSSKLNSDVTSHILSFLDHLSIVEVAKISWSFYNAALVSRQKRVSLAGCDSFAETGVWNFTGMKYFSGRENSHLVTNKFLWFLNEAHPILAHVDLHGCDNLDTLLVAHFVELMSPRLKSFIFKFLPTKNIDSSESKYLSEALSKAPCLESLSLTLNRTCSQNFQFSSFDGNTSLKKLSVIADGATMLPKCLLNLEVLRLEFVDENPQWYWQHLAQSQYPSLKRLDVTVSNYAYPALGLSIDALISVLAKTPNLQYLAIRRIQHHSPLDKSDDRKGMALSEELTKILYELGRDAALEKGEIKRLLAFAGKRNIVCTIQNTGITKD